MGGGAWEYSICYIRINKVLSFVSMIEDDVSQLH